MPKINILDKSVYSLIAAGEVIDKPASIVKELMENSIDAGAKNITIEVKDGGIEYIRVTDDGCGIEGEQMQVAFMPHTTSKIKNSEDLYNIGTLGFRGEALSTITAVSKVTMISKVPSLEVGNIIKINGGEVVKQEPIGSANGTTVIAEDLFYNIPARRKFLKKPKLEESEITNIVLRIILSHPDISIHYLANDKTVFKSSGNGLFDAIYSIYGKSIVDNLIQVNFEKNGIKVFGYIGKVGFVKPNRTYQTLIVNGRYVVNQSISTAIYKAFENYIMKSTFPFYVLNMTIDNQLVDVNVHPNKLDVKFSNSNIIFETFLTEISKIIMDSINIENVVLTNSNNEEVAPKLDLTNLKTIASNEGINYNNVIEEKAEIVKPVEVKVSGEEENVFYNYQSPTSAYDNFEALNYLKEGILKLNSANELEKFDNLKRKEEINQLDFASEIKETSVKIAEDYKIVGALFNTYIVIEYRDYICLIDQHAGHERILFDKYVQEYKNGNVCSQPLLIPIIINTNNVEFAYLEENLDVLTSLGYDIEEYGVNKFRVNSVPLFAENININEFFNEILANITNSKLHLDNNQIMRDYLAKTACKHAIKANDKLDKSQIEYLVNLLKDCEVLLCPHGRPIVLKITEKEIEKWFKRIV